MACRPRPRFAKLVLGARCGRWARRYGKNWFRDLDSNQDTQLQRLMSYRLDDPGMAERNCSRRKQGDIGGETGIDEMRRQYGGHDGIEPLRWLRWSAACGRDYAHWNPAKSSPHPSHYKPRQKSARITTPWKPRHCWRLGVSRQRRMSFRGTTGEGNVIDFAFERA
jgi:hypothetical protein